MTGASRASGHFRAPGTSRTTPGTSCAASMGTTALGIAAAAIAGAALAALGTVALGERDLVTTRIPVSVRDLPEPLAGLRIAQISDLHDTPFGPDGRDLVRAVEASRPDLIAFTGDILDRGTQQLIGLVSLARALVQIAPCVAVAGNHEGGTTLGLPLLHALARAGVTVLRDEQISLELRGAVVRIAGVDDPHLHGGPISRPYPVALDGELMARSLERAGLGRVQTSARTASGASGDGDEGPLILLAHRPELLDVYVDRGIDLVLTGHAHGGQWRVPGIGGLYAPNQGPFPRLTAGAHVRGRTTMIVSRGLKVRTLPPRLNNPPELVIAELVAG